MRNKKTYRQHINPMLKFLPIKSGFHLGVIGMAQEDKQNTTEKVQLALDPRFFNNELFWDLIDNIKLKTQVENTLKNLNDHFIKVVLNNDRNLEHFIIPVVLLRKSLSYIPTIDSILLKCCTDDKMRQELLKLFATKTIRAVLNPSDFDNIKFWELIYKHDSQTQKQIEALIRQLPFIFITKYKNYPCHYPYLRDVIQTCHHSLDLKIILLLCAKNNNVEEEVRDIYASLPSSDNDNSSISFSNNMPDTDSKDLLGRDLEKSKPYFAENPYHQEFNRKIELLRDKMSNYPNNKKFNNTVQKLCDDLTIEGNLYFSKVPSTFSFDAFKQNCDRAIQEARPELRAHRGCRKIIANILGFILTAGVGYALAAGVNIALNKGRFTLFSTDSALKVNDIEDCIHGAAPV